MNKTRIFLHRTHITLMQGKINQSPLFYMIILIIFLLHP